MQLLQVLVPTDRHVPVTEALDEMGVTYLQTTETSARDGTVLHVPVPRSGAEPVIDRLREAGLPETAYAVAADADAVTDADLGVDELADRYVEGPTDGAGIDHSSLRERAEELTPERRTYVAFAALSGIVAVAGLLLNSATVIVGAMVIAPFAGSSLSAAVGAVISDREMIRSSLLTQLLGLVVALVGAIGLSLALRVTSFVPPMLAITQLGQVASFITPSLLALAIAVAVGAIVLLFMNIVAINLTAYAGLVALGYRSSVLTGLREDYGLSVRTGAYALVVLVFAITLVVASLGTFQYLTFEHAANTEVQRTLDNEPYGSLTLESVGTSYSAGVIDSESPTVTVRVGRISESEYPELPTILRNRIETATDRSVTVQVRFVDYAEASATTSSSVRMPTDPITANRRHSSRTLAAT